MVKGGAELAPLKLVLAFDVGHNHGQHLERQFPLFCKPYASSWRERKARGTRQDRAACASNDIVNGRCVVGAGSQTTERMAPRVGLEFSLQQQRKNLTEHGQQSWSPQVHEKTVSDFK